MTPAAMEITADKTLASRKSSACNNSAVASEVHYARAARPQDQHRPEEALCSRRSGLNAANRIILVVASRRRRRAPSTAAAVARACLDGRAVDDRRVDFYHRQQPATMTPTTTTTMMMTTRIAVENNYRPIELRHSDRRSTEQHSAQARKAAFASDPMRWRPARPAVAGMDR
uniref:Uncharacterized protein n=1 Tax=Plectus sambesii TaxID=2011161 RepID=A0A914UM08_9BILA